MKCTSVLVEDLYEQTRVFEEAAVHMVIGRDELKNSGTTAFASLYKNKRPAHLVLAELQAWAELNNNTELLNKIQTLESEQIQ